jgi:hypothetical protein
MSEGFRKHSQILFFTGLSRLYPGKDKIITLSRFPIQINQQGVFWDNVPVSLCPRWFRCTDGVYPEKLPNASDLK